MSIRLTIEIDNVAYFFWDHITLFSFHNSKNVYERVVQNTLHSMGHVRPLRTEGLSLRGYTPCLYHSASLGVEYVRPSLQLTVHRYYQKHRVGCSQSEDVVQHGGWPWPDNFGNDSPSHSLRPTKYWSSKGNISLCVV